MARVGLSHPFMAEIDTENTNGTPTYKEGKEMAWGITADVDIDGGDPVVLYANNAIRESDSGFTGGKISLEIDDLSPEIYAELLGHALVTEETQQGIRSNANDTPPYFGIGYIIHRLVGGVHSYNVYWFFKTQFSEPKDSAKTKGEKTEFTTSTVEGTVMALTNGDWREWFTFDNQEDALAWLKTKANITQ